MILLIVVICLVVTCLVGAYRLVHVDPSSGKLKDVELGEILDAVAQDGTLSSSMIPYETVWAAVGGVAGLRDIRRNAIVLTIQCCSLQASRVATQDEIDDIIRTCAAVNISAAMGIFESLVVRVLPFVPRSYLVDAAKNYCILAFHWQNFIEIKGIIET